jgi:hypothetical protein
MSYDFCIREKAAAVDACVCGRKHAMFYLDLGDPTYNLGPIFREATSGMFAQGKEIPIDDARTMWANAAERMEREYEAFLPLQPDNGWGSLNGAIEVARKVVRAIDGLMSEPIEVRAWEAIEYEENPIMRVVDPSTLFFEA